MKKTNKLLALILAFSLVMSSLLILSSCKRENDNTDGVTPDSGDYGDGVEMSVSINGDEHLSMRVGETITLSATVVPESYPCTWSVIEENLDGDYTFDGGRFTAGNTAGYVVINASLAENTYDLVTIVINKTDSSNLKKVTFYAVDGISIVAVKYVEENESVTAPTYAVVGNNIVWVDNLGREVDFSSIVITDDTSFTAKSTASSVYYTVRYWYEDSSGEIHQIGDDFVIDFGNRETVPHEVLYNIETEVESLTEKNVINWRCEISDDQLTVDWYAELN